MRLTKHQRVVKFMQDNIGKRENPPGSNTGSFVRSCQAATWLAGTRWPWCVATWVKACAVAGIKLPYRGAGAYTLLAWYRKHLPKWVVPLRQAKPGSAVILNIGAGHLAVLEKPYRGGKYVHTIDGNWGDKVSRVAHPASLVRGCVDPVEGGVVPPAKPPVFDVVTSASGHRKLVYSSSAKAVGKKLPKLLNRFGGLTITRRKRKP